MRGPRKDSTIQKDFPTIHWLLLIPSTANEVLHPWPRWTNMDLTIELANSTLFPHAFKDTNSFRHHHLTFGQNQFIAAHLLEKDRKPFVGLISIRCHTATQAIHSYSYSTPPWQRKKILVCKRAWPSSRRTRKNMEILSSNWMQVMDRRRQIFIWIPRLNFGIPRKGEWDCTPWMTWKHHGHCW